ncbi:hypothetical protein AZE42_09906 [Rhizopogon vesiculosus]|uniref:CxC2-like cysteine cluster KDZ transposase-associated domain-containing protein n=1 Tax=Rhizopogon vesiculosus TaxID=180088 RepID=A0A1J8R645_9AGAM|nr:hypothetical protein AZE42_09906 [Rhizopogon vesiculosus]
MARQWRQCKLYKWHGFAHKDDEPKAGDLALFFPACPQLGINLDLSTSTATQPNDTPSWLITRSLVMDGNFKAEHLHPMNPSDEVSLMDGLAFMVRDERYKSHLSIAQDHIQKSDCNNHHAVNQANASWQKLEATGIGGCACACHGCFVPHSMVDFQKGERQMNMDYALSQALNYNTNGISRTITFYDINCQYHKNFKDRIASSMYLSIPIGMDLIPGISLWHVHGHQDSCYVRYASNFIHGTGRIDGEIMEMLWASLNIISPSARGMGTPHRKEVLDYQMNDGNFMKMIRITKFLCRKFKEATRGAAESKFTFKNLNDMAHPNMVILWEAEEALAQVNRLEDPSAMDIYEVWLEKGKSPTRKQQELRLLQAQNHLDHPVTNSPGRRGAATWLATSLTIEESQISLSKDVKRLGKHPTDIQLLRVAQLRDKLQTRITSFLDMAPTYLGFQVVANELDEPVDRVHTSELNEDYSDFDNDCNHNLDLASHHTSLFQPELTVLPLPSNIGPVRCKELGLTHLMQEETTLHEGQANDALHAIRVHLGDKAVIFQNTVQSAKSQASSTRAWAQVRSVEMAVNLNASIYSKCRSQLAKLPDHDLLTKYLPLKREHLKASSAVADPNAHGQRDTTLAWFWSMDVQGDTCGNDWMTEFYRVNWLQMKALCDCWNEEIILIKHEMQWSINFFNHKAKQWLDRQVILYSDGQITAGDISHALFYANSRFLAMGLYVDKSFATAMPGCSTVIPQLLHSVIAVMIHLTLVDRQPDMKKFLMDIKALSLSVDSDEPDEYDIARMPDYFNAWWKDNLASCRVSDMLPKLSVQDVMELVEDHFLELPDHVDTSWLPYMLKSGTGSIQTSFSSLSSPFPQHMATIPQNWALYQTYLADELVYDTFLSKIHRKQHLANVLATAYFTTGMHSDTMNAWTNMIPVEVRNDTFPSEEQPVLTSPSISIDSGGRIIVWDLPGAMTGMIMMDMHYATNTMIDLLKNSITTRKPTEWRTHESNFYPSLDRKITPGCINISPAWFQQGREKHGFPNIDPEDGFSPER